MKESPTIDEVIPLTRVVLHPDSPQWAKRAELEARRLEASLKTVLVTVHHIGSTAIGGILAKPIVDLLPVVTDLARLDALRGELRAIGYLWHHEYGIARRRYCTFTNPDTREREVQLHIFAENDPEIVRHVAFRDYLRAHPSLGKQYEDVKVRAAALHPKDALAYSDQKSEWIKRTEQEALHWFARAR